MTQYEKVKEQLKDNPKTWLITGVAGFIGSNLLETLLKLGQPVVGLDNFSTGHKHNLDEVKRLVTEEQWRRFLFISGDICNLEDCRKAVKGTYYILHQAALGSVPRSIEDPIGTNRANIDGFLNMLVAAKDEQVESFTYAASSSTYGDHPDLPKVEGKIGSPLSPYAVTKYVNELYAKVYKNVYGIDTIGLRYFNVFGKNQDPNGPYAAVIPKFITSFKNKIAPIINGDGSYSSDFTYIDNVVQMNYLALVTKNKSALNQIFNTACGKKIEIKTMAEIIRKEMSNYDSSINKIDIKFGSKRIGDVPHSKASIEKAEELLNYRPTHFFQEGILETIKWYMNQQN